VFLIFLAVEPSIKRIKVKDFEIELRSPPPFEFVLPPAVMETKILDLKTFLEQDSLATR